MIENILGRTAFRCGRDLAAKTGDGVVRPTASMVIFTSCSKNHYTKGKIRS